MIRIGLIDDNTNYLNDFLQYFTNNDSFSVSLLANSIEEVNLLLKNQPIFTEILFLDVNMPDISGIQALPKLRKLMPQTEIVMLTVVEDSDSLIKAFTLGANGYWLKSADFSELENQINNIKRGGAVMSPLMARKIITYFGPQKISENQALTERNLQVLRMLSDGWNYKSIASKLDISLDGVRFHIKQIYRALGVQSSAQAVKKYINGELPCKDY